MKKSLICGISGQDGAYLAKHLLANGYEVFGTSRDAGTSSFSKLKLLDIFGKVHLLSLQLTDFSSVLRVLRDVQPDEVYNLSGQSSVSLSFEQPIETFNSVAIGTLNLLEAIRLQNQSIKFFNAASSECFGDSAAGPVSEADKFEPKSPYGVAKSVGYWQVKNYRDAYGLFCCSGILFNHESPLRHQRFVTRKIINAAAKIAEGERVKLALGNIEVIRDWGWAPEYVVAMWLMLQQSQPIDYIIATGKSYKLKEFVEIAFECFSLDWQEHVEINESLSRPSEIMCCLANPSKILKDLGWQANIRMPGVIERIIGSLSK